MRSSLRQVLLSWWRSRRAFDAVDPRAGSAALLRSPAVLAAAGDLPKINRCPGVRGKPCASFVKAPGVLCHRCDPGLLDRERLEREARARPAGAARVSAFRKVKA